jgi:hypothetical protein
MDQTLDFGDVRVSTSLPWILHGFLKHKGQLKNPQWVIQGFTWDLAKKKKTN